MNEHEIVVLTLYKEYDNSPAHIRKLTGYSTSFIYKTLYNAGKIEYALGNTIAEYRNQGLTIVQIGKLLNISKSTVCNYCERKNRCKVNR